MTDTLASIEAQSMSGPEKRRSSRVPAAVPITVSGVDALGEPFREITTTLSVSCNGCKYRSKNYVQRDSLVTLEVAHSNPRLSPRVVRGRARWVQRPRNLREQYEIGLELIVSGNIWGLPAPPPDWFPHPDDIAAELEAQQEAARAAEAQPAEPAADPVPAAAENLEAQDDAAEAAPTAQPLSASAFEEIDIARAIGFTPEEAESTQQVSPEPPQPFDLNTRVRETVAASLKTMVDRIAEAAALDMATRISSVIDEARAACGAASAEFETKIRGAIDDALHPREVEAISAVLGSAIEKQTKKRARKPSKKKAKQSDEADTGNR